MNYTEILDKIKNIVINSDEYIGVLVNLENITAVSVAGRSYFEECSAPLEVENEICALFRTIESVVKTAKFQLVQLTDLIRNTADDKIIPESNLAETEGAE